MALTKKRTGTGSDSFAKPKILQLDFTGVEGKRGRRIPEGDYLFKITDWGVNNEKQLLRIKVDILKGPTEGEFSDILSLKQNSLWKVRAFLEACGLKLKSSLNKMNLEKLMGRTFGATVADDDYGGKTNSRMNDFFTKEEYEALSAGGDDAEDEDEDEDEEDEDVDVTSDDEDDDEIDVDEEEDEDEDDDDI